MWDARAEADRWRRQAANDLQELGGILDQYDVPTHYPNGLAGGVPFEAFGESQATAAVDAAQRFVLLAERHAQARD